MVQCALTLRVDCRLRVHSVNPDNTPTREEILAGLREGVGVSLKHKHLWSALVVGSEVSPPSPLAACTDTSGNRRSVILLYFIRKFARRVSDLRVPQAPCVAYSGTACELCPPALSRLGGVAVVRPVLRQ